MKEGYLIMNEQDRKRLEILSRVKREEITLLKAAELMGVCYRHALRLKQKYFESGDVGIIHKSRGKTSNRAKPKVLKEKVLKRYQDTYSDFGPTLAAEKLAEEGIKIDACTLWRWLINAGLWNKKSSIKSFRKRRESRKHFGELVQMDGSVHDWFEGRADKCNLMNMIDDATGINHSFLCDEESTENALKVLYQWIEKYGIPHSLYTDRKNVYCPLTRTDELTQFGRACKDLGISIIFANSPQAKGKIERSNGLYQDRFVKELRLRGINTIDQANNFLKEEFIEKLNQKFSVQPLSSVDLHAPAPEGLVLLHTLSVREKKKISNDWTIRWKNRIFQIIAQPGLPIAKAMVELRVYLDGSIHLFYQDKELKFLEIKKKSGEGVKSVTQRKQEYFKALNYLREEGYTILEIANRVGLSESTVKAYFKRGGIPCTTRVRTSKLSPYDKLIRNWIETENLIPKDIHLRLVNMGFKGSRRNTERYVMLIKKEKDIATIIK